MCRRQAEIFLSEAEVLFDRADALKRVVYLLAVAECCRLFRSGRRVRYGCCAVHDRCCRSVGRDLSIAHRSIESLVVLVQALVDAAELIEHRAGETLNIR